MHPELGHLITGEEKRDAIHIAIAPVTAKHDLKPGEHIGFTELKNTEVVGRCNKPIGIVDPFLKKPVKAGERFFMCLYQKTITSLRHDWSHPDFTAAEVANVLDPSHHEIWLREFAANKAISYRELMSGASRFQIEGGHSATICLGDTDTEVPDEFWDHWQAVTGLTPRERSSFFSCAC